MILILLVGKCSRMESLGQYLDHGMTTGVEEDTLTSRLRITNLMTSQASLYHCVETVSGEILPSMFQQVRKSYIIL